MMVLLAHLFHQIQEPLKFETNTKLVCRLPSKALRPVKCMHVNGVNIINQMCDDEFCPKKTNTEKFEFK